MNNHRTPFNCVEHFCSMEAKCRYVAIFQYGLSIHFDTKSMSCIVNDFQPIFVSNLLNTDNIAWFTITMDWHNCCCSGGYCDFNTIWIDATITRININKHRF